MSSNSSSFSSSAISPRIGLQAACAARAARRPGRIAAGALCVAAFAGLGGAASAQFLAGVSVPVGAEPDSVAVGDWDGDLDLDLAVPVDAPDRVVFLFNDGAGGFGGAVSVNTGSNTGPHTAVAADFDGDGDQDVAVSLQNANSVRVLLNNGAGGFTLGSQTAAGAEPRALRVGDFNGGAPDLVVANRDSSNVSVLLNGGAATFTVSTLATGGDPRDVQVGDLNGDGDADFAVASHADRRLDLYANNGAGAFSAAGSLSLGAQLRPDGVVAADLDGDGDLDLAAAASGNVLNVAVRFTNIGAGSGAGAFSAFTSFPVGGVNPQRIVATDADLDGDLDLATVNEDSSNVSVLANNGAGVFGAATLFAVGAAPDFLIAADLDGNGSEDLATSNQDSGSVTVLLNQNAASAFENLGGGLAGAAGIPLLTGTGTLAALSPVAITLSGAAPSAPAALVAGLTQVNAPFKGGTLVPADDVLLVLATSVAGSVTLAGTWPAGIASGTDLFVQAIVVDAGAVQGFALSNALRGTTP